MPLERGRNRGIRIIQGEQEDVAEVTEREPAKRRMRGRPLAGASEIWALRHGGQLVAVLSRKDDGAVDALNGPENDPVAPEYLWPVLSWLAAAGFPLGELEIPAEALVAHMRRPRDDALAA